MLFNLLEIWLVWFFQTNIQFVIDQNNFVLYQGNILQVMSMSLLFPYITV